MKNQSFLLSLLAVLFVLAVVSAPVLAYDDSGQGAAEIVVAGSDGDGDKDHHGDKDDHDHDHDDKDDDKHDKKDG